MPRRNHRPRTRRPRVTAETTTRKPSTDELARRLVREGLASPLILGRIPIWASQPKETE